IFDIQDYLISTHESINYLGIRGWIELIEKKRVMPQIIFYSSWTGLFLLPFWYRKNTKKRFLQPFIIWFVLYHAILFFKINRIYPHYYLPVIFAYFLIFSLILEELSNRIKNQKIQKSMQLIALMMVILFSLNNLQTIRAERVQKVENAPEIRMGNWIKHHLNFRQSFILSDKYTYVPGEFPVFKEWGLEFEHEKTFNPTHILVTSKIMHRYRCEKAEKTPRLKSEKFMKKCAYYEQLFKNKARYELVHKEDSIFLFEIKDDKH
ncbi:MAG: hypothetical protein D6707_05920, partial [Bacteroidetes bacterium]